LNLIMLARFEIIVAVDRNGGISLKNSIPWNVPSDMKYFKDTTIGNYVQQQQNFNASTNNNNNKNQQQYFQQPIKEMNNFNSNILKNNENMNYVIMGRNTFLSIPEQFRPLSFRKTIVISKTLNPSEFQSVTVCKSLGEALVACGRNQYKNEGEKMNQNYKVFICGGSSLYEEAIFNYMYLCDMIHITEIKGDYGCDNKFPFEEVKLMNFELAMQTINQDMYFRYLYKPKVNHEEYKYLNLLSKILYEGEHSTNRTTESTIKLFGETVKYDIRHRIPVLTTKKMFIDKAIKELLFFVSGSTDTKILERKGVSWWKENTSKKNIEKLNLNYEEGDMGPSYGHLLRHFGAEYNGCDVSYKDKGYDQIHEVVKSIKMTPHSRRHIIVGWHPNVVNECPLPPCHGLIIQFNVSGDNNYLDIAVTQRSADMFIGVPYNVLSYSIFLYMIAHITGYKPRYLVHTMNDCHIYDCHIDKVKTQLGRTPYPFPTLTFNDGHALRSIDDFDETSFNFSEYQCHTILEGKMIN
jgi:thymidylate synthase